MWRALRTNLGYKIAALIIALILFYYRYGAQVSTEQREFAVELKVLGVPAGFVVSGVPQRVKLTVSARHQTLEALRAEQVQAYVRVGKHMHKQRLKVSYLVPAGYQVTKVVPEIVKLRIEELVTKLMKVEVAIYGIENKNITYGALAPKIWPEQVQVSGPRSKLLPVKAAAIFINIRERKLPINESFEVYLLDESRWRIYEPQLQIQPNRVSVKLAATTTPIASKAVEVVPKLLGQPASGFRVQMVSVEPRFVELRGDPAVLRGLSVIATAPIDITGAQGEIREEVELKLPDGVNFSSVNKVSIIIKIVRQP